jgi:hypothetical protein
VIFTGDVQLNVPAGSRIVSPSEAELSCNFWTLACGPLVIAVVVNPAFCQVVCAFRIFFPMKSGTIAMQGIAVGVGVGWGEGYGAIVGVGVGLDCPPVTNGCG